MNYFNRFLTALEKIAEQKPVTVEQIKEMFEKKIKTDALTDHEATHEKNMEKYLFLKFKQGTDLPLSDSEKDAIIYGDHTVKISNHEQFPISNINTNTANPEESVKLNEPIKQKEAIKHSENKNHVENSKSFIESNDDSSEYILALKMAAAIICLIAIIAYTQHYLGKDKY